MPDLSVGSVSERSIEGTASGMAKVPTGEEAIIFVTRR